MSIRHPLLSEVRESNMASTSTYPVRAVQEGEMMNQPPLNPDALEAASREVFREVLGFTKTQSARVAHRAVSAYLSAAQPVVNSVEGIPAQVQVISWEEEPEHECWKLAPDETFVGLIVKSDRAWSPADKYTLNIQRPAVDDA